MPKSNTWTTSAASDRDARATEWLLASSEPGIVLQARRDLLGEKISWTASDVIDGPIVSRLLVGQSDDGGFGVHPYQKWMGAHWRLVSLVELGVTADDARVKKGLESVLAWLASDPDEPEDAPRFQGRYRVHGSIYANALAVATRLGKASDPRVRNLADWLLFWQWPDGGWNCDRHPRVTHSSFYESITPMWALAEFGRAAGNQDAAAAARRTAEFFLDHRVFKSHSKDRVGDQKWLRLRYPEYWHYDYLHGLLMLSRVGALPDKRAEPALDLLRQQQQPDGSWQLEGPQYWKGRTGLYGDAAAWDKTSASQMLTLNALRVLRATDA
jgi:hypothetical protein